MTRMACGVYGLGWTWLAFRLFLFGVDKLTFRRMFTAGPSSFWYTATAATATARASGEQYRVTGQERETRDVEGCFCR